MAAGRGNGKKRQFIAIQAIILAILMLVLVFVEIKYLGFDHEDPRQEASAPGVTPPAVTPIPVETATPTPEATPQPTPTPTPAFEPYAVEATKPEKFISSTGIQVKGEKADTYEMPAPINFGMPEDFTTIPGVFTFRGNNFRDGGAYGTVDLTESKLERVWTKNIGALTSYNGYTWTGSGWTGQALVAKWDKETRALMRNMKDWAKEQDELVEVIHATMDGYVYFSELGTGEATRDRLYLGFTFKGAGSLDPRGYPILYVGAGYYGASQSPRALAVSLIDGSILFELGGTENFAHRQWHMFDSAPLVSADTDQLIWPGESGLLYIVDMNTDFDRENGTLTMEPEIVKWRYQSIRNSNTGGQYWLGFEGSAITWQHYLFMADNGGHFMCLDLNTLELVWVQDVLDDTNCTPVLELENGHPYLYISTSFHAGWRSWTTAEIPIWKIDAVTGEIVWQTPYTCSTEPDLSGGVQGSIAVGKNKLSDLIFVPVAKTPNVYGGVLSALDKATGEVVWELKTQTYSWSSPVCIYDKAGNGYLLFCTSGVGNSNGGHLCLIDGLTGRVLTEVALGSTTEASPVVYNDMAVIGTRGQQLFGYKIK